VTTEKYFSVLPADAKLPLDLCRETTEKYRGDEQGLSEQSVTYEQPYRDLMQS
jgi:hypothetical protein